MQDGENIMVILSSPSGVGKQQSQKYNKNINHLKFLYLIQQDHQGRMK